MKIRRFNQINATASYALLHITAWGFYGVITNFSSHVLYDLGFSDSRISLLLGVATALAFVLQLGLAELVSRSRKLKVWGALSILGVVMLVSNLMVLMPQMPAWAAVASFGVACMLVQMISPFVNAIGMDAIKRGSPTNFSIARGFGSLGYSVMAYVTGMVVRSFGNRMVPTVGMVWAAVLMAAVVWYHLAGERNLERSAVTEQKRERKKNFLAAYPRFAVFLVAAVFLQLSHNLLVNFLYQIILVKNGTAAEQGIASAICGLVEIPVMIFFPLMMRKIRCDKWVRFASLFIAVKSIGFFLAATPYGVYAAQATQILGYGLYTISSVNYAELVVDNGESVRAQSYLGATCTVGSLLAAASGGVICQYFGVQTMIVVSIVTALIGGITIALAAQKTK